MGGFEGEPFIREDRGQILKGRPASRLLRIQTIDCLYFQQTEMALRLTGRAHVSDHEVSRAKIKATELCLGDIYILIADPIVRGAQESDALAHDLEDPTAELDPFLLRFCLADLQDEGFLLQPIEIWDTRIFGKLAQFCQRFVFKL